MNPRGVILTEYIIRTFSMQWNKRFEYAKQGEINGLFKQKSLKVVHENDVPKRFDILGVRFVLVLKNVEAYSESNEPFLSSKRTQNETRICWYTNLPALRNKLRR